MNLIFDLETNGLLKMLLPSTALAIHDLETKETLAYNDTGNQEPIVTRDTARLLDAETSLVTTSLATTFLLSIKLYPWFSTPTIVVDTLLLSRLYHSDMMSLDKKHNWKHMPLKLYGRHSLESYGYRLGELKVSSVKTQIGKTGHKRWKIIAYKTFT